MPFAQVSIAFIVLWAIVRAWEMRQARRERSAIAGRPEQAPQGAPCIHTVNELGHCTRCGARPADAST